MTQPTLPRHTSRRELRKAMLRMRLEMRRQEIRHEALLLTQPLRQVKDFSLNLRSGSAPIWLTTGVLTFVGIIGGKRGWRRWLRLALLLAPLLRRRNSGTHPPENDVTKR
ncbi:conserved hypothetical protein [Pseudomonas sp. 8Z]|uniref:hypothetical protein n=1 Tax=Pseudomonas sp. 8Z TaxID=2653166 RepID=UPI0012F158E4|nr:hypothetical protein [Pseudomonas sp. 8Z]VXC67811.1 conserved hypothetical protein [Pseudomonas sp. 8Z]